jgi:methyl-accepting chemotaxis protein
LPSHAPHACSSRVGAGAAVLYGTDITTDTLSRIRRARTATVSPVSNPSNSRQLTRIAEVAVRLGTLGPRLAKLAADVDDQAQEQAARAQSIAENMDALAVHLEEATRQLRQSSGDVERALGTVTRIAQHTRILAINASIEASRAGVHGRPFAIVVQEVQRLADGTGKTTEEIEQRLREMRDSITRVASMTSSESEMLPMGAFEVSDSIPTVARANEQVHGMAGSAARQLASADELSVVGGDVKSVADALLLAIGTFRFAAHARAEREMTNLLREIGRTDLARETLERIMAAWIERHRHFELVYFTDADGRQVVDNIVCADGRVRHEAGYRRDWSERAWYRNAIASPGVCTTDIYRSTATGDFCFTISAALRDATGETRGVLGADVNFQQLLAQ